MVGTVVISAEEYRELVAAAREGEMLKAMICERADAYQRLEHTELSLLKQLFGCEENKESEE